ncbi:hypothetical protein AT15_07440 [Kosmotoga arenicorallina S304]|uniref:tRNA(Met) cytidine acetate ligase n=1 Tax=Kosmotoga arenicorallina S304 TaxID=1453497 RepID=A0A182C750_9BACT|nr:nucleotidyltransferase [Kosmotoga arenicorallina]OAA31321.1 hypothetical protein AT15_07440 [Kosmotoga arenicorallina S304]
MSVLGLVVEYNPFHNGHLYHLQKAKELTDPEVTVAVMSGNFVQRGEPAIIDKYARAEVALRAGIDLVVQLPLIYSIQDAGGFALGSIWTLDLLKVSDVVFGSESDNLKLLKRLAQIVVEEPQLYLERLKVHLKSGVSFPNARKYALRDYLALNYPGELPDIEEASSSNNILGLEYLAAIKKLGSTIRPHSIKRQGADYNDPEFKGSFSSATAIREMVLRGETERLKETVPDFSREILLREIKDKGAITLQSMEKLLMGLLRTTSRDEYAQYYGFVEGLDARFERCAESTSGIFDFLECVKTKRFTFTRIKRLVMNLLFKLTDEIVKNSWEKGPQYIKVLGFNEKGRAYLSSIKKNLGLPLITAAAQGKNFSRISSYEGVNLTVFREQFQRDLMGAAVYGLFQRGNLPDFEYKRHVIYRRG